MACRCALPNAVVLLCVWHVINAWLKQLRCKLRNKALYQHFFKLMHSGIMYMKANKNASREQVQRAVQAAVDKFVQECMAKGEGPLLEYYEKEWGHRLGAHFWLMAWHAQSFL